jgi:hypothetical protein
MKKQTNKTATGSNRKTWSYKAVTEDAEKEIRDLMQESMNSKDDFRKQLYQGWAYGVFLGWKSLTMGWITSEDLKRLEALTKPKAKDQE